MAAQINTADHHDVFVAFLRAVGDLATPGDEHGAQLVRRVEAAALELLLHIKRQELGVVHG